MFEEMTVAKMYNLNETIAKDIFEGVTYPWEVLPKISDFIVKLGETLPADEYDKVGENVCIAKSAKVFESAYIHGSLSYNCIATDKCAVANLCIFSDDCRSVDIC